MANNITNNRELIVNMRNNSKVQLTKSAQKRYLHQCQKYNVGELPNVKKLADVSSEGPSSERLPL